MNKKLLGALLVTGAAAAIVATRDLWVPLVKAGGQEVLLWVMDDLEDDEDEDETPGTSLVDHWNEEGVAH